jgi:hypothetical protein
MFFAIIACNMVTRGSTPVATQQALVVATTIPQNTIAPPTIETLLPLATITDAPSVTAPASPTPFGCERPPDDYSRIVLPGDMALNQRTVAMLEHAQVLYGGTHEFMLAVTQGSYNIGVDASFGTHDGGGAVDLSIRDLTNWSHVLYEEVDQIISALRHAGFAAWLRDTDSLYPGSPVHIHAIAIGDAELSEAAQSQLTGPEGYFRGYNGLPEDTQPDIHGGPILCPWMVEMGYEDLR